MAKLDTFQTQLIENLFHMKSGYVLDFSDRTMGDFFESELGINIYDEKYNIGSGSKANRLRGFIKSEDDKLVGKAIHKLITYIENNILIEKFNKEDYPQKIISAVKEIAAIMTGSSLKGTTNNANEKEQSKTFPENTFGLFISHRDSYKAEAFKLKESLSIYGITGFVAHEDIEPSSEWQNEIEKALFSMDSLLALLSTGFSASVWTNQEVGVAFGREVFILSVKAGEDPKGLVGKFQALRPKSADSNDLAIQIAEHLIKNPRTSVKMKSAFIHALSYTSQYSETERWALLLSHVDSLTEEQSSKVLENYNSNSQAYDCFSLNGGRYGSTKNIADYLNEWVHNKRYTLRNKKLEEVSNAQS